MTTQIEFASYTTYEDLKATLDLLEKKYTVKLYTSAKFTIEEY